MLYKKRVSLNLKGRNHKWKTKIKAKSNMLKSSEKLLHCKNCQHSSKGLEIYSFKIKPKTINSSD